MRGRIIGLIVLALVIAAGVGVAIYGFGVQDITVVQGTITPDKADLFEDPEVQRILKWKYGLEVSYREAGSLEMIDSRKQRYDFFFTGSPVPQGILETAGIEPVSTETVFYSPLVLYSWDLVLEGTDQSGLFLKEGDFTYMDMVEYQAALQKGASWRDMGSGAQGDVLVQTADPGKSASALMYYGLLGTVLNSGQGPDVAELEALADDLRQGLPTERMDHSADALFKDYLRMGPGAKSMVAGYESQFLSFAYHHPTVWESVKDRMEVVYPKPTVWAEHTVISLTEGGQRLSKALQDPDIQARARERHGYRTGTYGQAPAEGQVMVASIPEDIKYVVGQLNDTTMQKLRELLQEK